MSIAEVSKASDLIDFLVNQGNGVKGLSQIGLKNVPEKFIQPQEERLDFTQIVSSESIPIIDLSNCDDPKVAESICDAAEKWGFFQIINHGIHVEVLENVLEAGHKFFELPVEERRKYLKENSPTHTVQLKTSFSPLAEKVLEWKDYLFHIYDSEDESSTMLWPVVSKDQVLEYMKWAKTVIVKLLEVLLKGLNVKQIDEALKSVVMGSLIVNLIHYPKCPNPELAAGAGRHADVSSITMLLQDDVGGLYVREPKGDGWIHVPPVKGALVINIGDVLQIMSNDRYKSVEHRVIVNANRNRVSVPIFVNPAPDAVFGPLPQVLENGEKPFYK
ncbi:bi-functional coumaroyl CoA and feruloyl CoA ortho-hydroxylase F6H2-2-1-like [Nicotiana tomentosiformis]|uniref:bi-functional coumaroyl CoA and feruloyl CoA ortho-hydroxylase F6H2-2-1-like n=1 Tax=Nicotiana tomentosiformis TaxID=4098 RepID=UPI000878B3E3|nr:bi-functional coumaroyl CoA and feruloyl CoA ortho-hydroxylase F6H2-2-1-like [Nicotiana tomentosiformis]